MQYQEVIEKICQEEQIKYKKVSNDWIYVLEKNKKIRYIVGYTFGLNQDSIAKILDDKFALYDTLNYHKIPIIEHNLLYKDYDKRIVESLFNKYHHDVVIKANLGCAGQEVFHIKNLDDLYLVMDKLFIKNYSLSLCPYMDIKTEYRVIVLNKKIRLIYGKVKPVVMGNGHSTYQELLEEFNPNFFKNNFVSNEILKDKEKKEYNWQFNLSKGAMPISVDNPRVIHNLEKIVNNILKVMDINFASIDIALIKNDFLVLEINNGVTLTKFMNVSKTNQKIAYDIYKDAIKSLFGV